MLAVQLVLGVLLIVAGIFKLLPHLKSPFGLFIGGAVLLVASAVEIVRLRSRDANRK